MSQFLEDMVSEIKMRSDSVCRYWVVSLTSFLLIVVEFRVSFDAFLGSSIDYFSSILER